MVTRMLMNPVYAIDIDPDLTIAHEPMISRDEWIGANSRLIAELGAEAYLELLLTILEGDYPRSPG
jgi:hypothetical protein